MREESNNNKRYDLIDMLRARKYGALDGYYKALDDLIAELKEYPEYYGGCGIYSLNPIEFCAQQLKERYRRNEQDD